MKFHNFILDKFQEDSAVAIGNNYSVVVSAPTGSGKTLIADYIIHKHKDDDKRIIYTAPIKALSNQKYKDFSLEYGESKVGLMTGDIVINPTAKILIMTTEIYRNMVVGGDTEETKNIAYVIFDEVHYINDFERGYIWEESIIYSPKSIRFLCLSATIPNAVEFSNWIQAIKGHEVKTVVATKRNVPLKVSFYDVELGLTTLEKIRAEKETPNYYKVMNLQGNRQTEYGSGSGRRNRSGDGDHRHRHRQGGRQFQSKNKQGGMKMPAPNHVDLIKELGGDKLPCLYFHFSRKACQQQAQELTRKNIFSRNREIVDIMNEKLRDAPSDINKLKTTQALKQTLPYGVGFHHAGILPILKELIEELFAKGLIKVLYVTETFAVGINMPAKTVCFDSLRKYDGRNFRNLNTKEFFQIAGRAGRRGIDTIGYVVVMIYRPTFRYNEVHKITKEDVEPIKSQFKLSINTVLNLVHLHTEKEIEHLLRVSFYSYQKFGNNYDKIPTKVLLSRYRSIIKKLIKYEYLSQVTTYDGDGEKIKKRITFGKKNAVTNKLTDKGIFSSKIFSEEILTGEFFATDLYKNLDEYQILLVICSIIYELRLNNKFKTQFKDDKLRLLRKTINSSDFLSQNKKFDELGDLTTLIKPIYDGKTFFDVLELTNFLEGDLIRIYAQILDRIGQIKKASSDTDLLRKLANCQGIIKNSLEGIYLV